METGMVSPTLGGREKRKGYVIINGKKIERNYLLFMRQLLLYECNGLTTGRRTAYISLKKDTGIYGGIEVVLKKVDHYIQKHGGSNEESN